ncbi:hypothetical protein [Deinococcus aquatilis]|uniref:hypothetical protein n=1 Tax=Deinococcus aquatilis TaxID=519440 RepID=UPI0012FCA223|nr:hypothetical protein [Deinococcus aquatilis]
MTPPNVTPGPYTAVVTIHGMGDPRRYDTLCNLVDTLERYASLNPVNRGTWRSVDGRRWQHQLSTQEYLYYVRATYLPPDQQGTPTRVRFFEAYWAPKLAGGLPFWDVIKWFLKQIPKAWQRGQAPWRSFTRIKVAELYQWLEQQPPGQQANAQALLGLYNEFEQIPQLISFPEGTFDQFVEFIEAQAPNPQQATLVGLAHTWKACVDQANRRAFWSALGFAALVVALLVWIVTLIGALTSRSWAPLTSPLGFWAENGTGRAIVQLFLGVLLANGVGSFVSTYLGDVATWATYDENDEKFEKRKEILRTCTETLEAVVQDPACERVVIVAHSLGSQIAYETLRWLNYRRLAQNGNNETGALQDLDKIKQLVTYGSPIDKIYYFMESRNRFSHRYERTYNKMVGDAGKMPFQMNGQPHLLWVNFHTPGDAISGPVQTPNDLTSAKAMIYNVPTVNYDSIHLGRNHSGYLDNALVVEWIHRVVIDSTADRGNVPLTPPTPSPLQPQAQAHLKRTQALYTVLLTFPLAVLAALFAGLMGQATPAIALWGLTLWLLGGVAWRALSTNRHVNPVR